MQLLEKCTGRTKVVEISHGYQSRTGSNFAMLNQISRLLNLAWINSIETNSD